MKKRAVTMILTATMLLSLCGCVEENAKTTQPGETPAVTTEPTAATPTATPPEPTASVELSAATAEPAVTPTIEPSEDVELFQAFLRGEVEAVAGDDFHNSMQYVGYRDDVWMGTDTMSVQELTELVEGPAYQGEVENYHIEMKADYAILKTMGGRPMLVMRYDKFLGYEAFLSYFIFGNYDGQLHLTYARDSWSRSYTELHEGLIFSGYGSGGAGDHFTWCGYIGEDGYYQIVYDGELLSGLWVAMDAYEIFGVDDIDWSSNCLCELLTTDEGKFYDLDGMEGADLADTDQEKLALLRQYYAEQGYTEVDDAEAVIADAKAAHGMEDPPVIEDWTHWEITK